LMPFAVLVKTVALSIPLPAVPALPRGYDGMNLRRLNMPRVTGLENPPGREWSDPLGYVVRIARTAVGGERHTHMDAGHRRTER